MTIHITEGLFVLLATFAIIALKKLDPRWAFLIGGFVLKLLSQFNGSSKGAGSFIYFGVANADDWIHLALITSVVFFAFGFSEILDAENYTNDALNLFTAGIKSRQNTKKIISILIAVLATWFVSFSLLSASAACGFVAPFLLPLLIRMGVRFEFACATILAGGWGTIINPADVNASTINSTLNHLNIEQIQLPKDHFIPAVIAILIISLILRFRLKSYFLVPSQSEAMRSKLKPIRALMLFSPFILLTMWEITNEFYISNYPVSAAKNSNDQSQIAIIISFFICCLAALLIRKKKLNYLLGRFSKGALEGILDVILLIIAAKFLIEGFKQCVGETTIAHWIYRLPVDLRIPCAVIITFLFAIGTGSGDAIITSTVLVFASASANDPSLLNLKMAASMIWFSGEIGRCASPNSAAVRKLAKAASSLKNSEVDPNKIVSITWPACVLGLLAALTILSFFLK